MSKKLIPMVFKTYTEFRGLRTDPINSSELPELDYKNIQADVRSINQFIRGVLKIPVLGNRNIDFLKCDKIYFINDRTELLERDRTEEELIDSTLYGRFEYTKSLAGIERFLFNKSVAVDKKVRDKLHEIVSDLILDELERQKRK